MPKQPTTTAGYHDYDDRYCAYVDVLGFSGLIAKITHSRTAEQKAHHFGTVYRLLRTVHAPPIHPDQFFNLADIKAQSISDAVAISSKVGGHSLLLLLDLLERFSLNVLSAGFFMRGAVVRGALYHDKEVVFGDALIRAYNLESTVARYPRIIIERTISTT